MTGKLRFDNVWLKSAISLESMSLSWLDENIFALAPLSSFKNSTEGFSDGARIHVSFSLTSPLDNREASGAEVC